MLTAIVGWMKGNLFFSIFGGIALLVLGIYIGSLHVRIGAAKAEAGEYKGQVAELRGEKKAMEDAYLTMAQEVARQNKAVQALKAESDRRKRQSIEALKQAAKEKKAVEDRMKWYAQQLAKPDAKDCAAALRKWREQK